jgi:thiamine transporter
MVALAVLLDFLFKAIPFMEMPTGGSFSLAMMPVILNGYRNGTKWGIISGICYAVINFMIDGFWWHWGSIFFDYLIAFGILGLSGLFKNILINLAVLIKMLLV